MATRVEDLDRSISYTLQPSEGTEPEQRMSLKSIYEAKDIFGWFWQVTVDIHAIHLTLRLSRSLILDIRLGFTDEG